MTTREALLVDAFATEPTAGNPAGVVPDAAGLSETQMGAIANELGASETAFVCEGEDADLAFRYFTPTAEVDLCGHATVAATLALHERGKLEAGAATVETEVGTLDLAVEDDGRAWMSQDDPTLDTVEFDLDDVAAALGIDVAALRDVGADLPLATASTGLPWLVVPVNFLEHLGNADPDAGAIDALASEAGAVGVYPFTFDTLEAESTIHARAFAPGSGVPEDPVTGTAAGACSAYLDHHAVVETDDGLRIEQGHFVDRPGYVDVRLEDGVRVGGRAVTTLEGQVVLPSDEDDEILEA
ncbi:MAG: PhzF family phenazine biosynthesis protein [Haloarculaceae archaeon]